MFKDTEQGETHYCPMCEEWSQKCNELQKENEHLKDFIQDLDDFCHKFQIALGQTDILCVELINKMSDVILKYPYKTKADKYKAALEEIRESFLCFHQITIPFHVGDVAKLPHSLVDMISDYCTKIQNKIDKELE